MMTTAHNSEQEYDFHSEKIGQDFADAALTNY